MFGMTRGERNNNPLNIRISDQTFKGEIVPSKDKAFKQFETAIMGIRAGAKILGNYYKLHGLSTVSQIISRWAPDSENDTSSYISDVCRLMAVKPNDQIDVLKPSVLASLVTAVIYHENGAQPYRIDEINQAVDSALNRIV